MGKFCVILVTAPAKEAGKIQEALVRERLAACVNSLPVSSCYAWKGRTEKAREQLLIIKTRTGLLDRLIRRVKELHPYEVPEIIALPVMKGSKSYLDWIGEETR